MEIIDIDVLTIIHRETQELAYSPATCSELNMDFQGPTNSFWVKQPTEAFAEIEFKNTDIEAYCKGGFPKSVTFQGHEVGQVSCVERGTSRKDTYKFTVVLNGMLIPELQKVAKKINIEHKRFPHPRAGGF